MRDVYSRGIYYIHDDMHGYMYTVTSYSYIALKRFKILPPKLQKGSHIASYHVAQNSDA